MAQLYRKKQSELNYQHDQLRQLEFRINDAPELAAEIRTLKRKSETLAAEIQLIDQEIEAWTLSSSMAGMVVPAEPGPRRLRQATSLEPWRGTYSQPRNLGCYVTRGEHLLTICDPEDVAVSAKVRESEMELVEIGQPIQVRFEQAPNRTCDGQIFKILKQELPLGNRNPDSMIESYIDSAGQTRFVQVPFRVEVSEIEVPDQVLLGSTGRAKISVRSQTVAQRLGRWIKNTLASN